MLSAARAAMVVTGAGPAVSAITGLKFFAWDTRDGVKGALLPRAPTGEAPRYAVIQLLLLNGDGNTRYPVTAGGDAAGGGFSQMGSIVRVN